VGGTWLLASTAPTAHGWPSSALDASAAVFDRTGTVWEFDHPFGGEPTALRRKPQTPYNHRAQLLGHNPLLAWRASGRRRSTVPSRGAYGAVSLYGSSHVA
jgi:hypothetical protein